MLFVMIYIRFYWMVNSNFKWNFVCTIHTDQPNPGRIIHRMMYSTITIFTLIKWSFLYKLLNKSIQFFFYGIKMQTFSFSILSGHSKWHNQTKLTRYKNVRILKSGRKEIRDENQKFLIGIF